MEIIVNGEPRTFDEPASVAELLQRMAVPHERVAVEVNEEVVPRGTYAARRLASGDRVEIVHFVGGG